MLAPLAEGTSRIDGLAPGADVAATAAALGALGAGSPPASVGHDSIEISGPVGLTSHGGTIDCGNSGTTARLLTGLIAGHPIAARLDGDESLRRRPMARVVEPLRAAGAEIDELGAAGHLPLEIRGGALAPIEHRLEVASAQVKSALLLAGLSAGVPVVVIEPGRSRDHTERLLRAMGVGVESEPVGRGQRVRLEPPPGPLRPISLTVPGDISSAAFFIALAVLGGAGEGLRIAGVGLNPGRTGFLRALELMGTTVEAKATGEQAGEPVGEIVASASEVRGARIPEGWVPTLLDEIPILACVAARAAGVTVISGAAELRVKESDRIAALSQNLAAIGVSCRETPDGLVIEGSDRPLAGRIACAGDHRIAMAFGVLGALPGNEIEMDDTACIAVSYPEFWAQLAEIEEATARG